MEMSTKVKLMNCFHKLIVTNKSLITNIVLCARVNIGINYFVRLLDFLPSVFFFINMDISWIKPYD